MIDIRLLREKPDEVRAGYQRLGTPVDLDAVLARDARVRDLKNESQTLQAEQNRLSKEIGRAAPGEAREQAKAASLAFKEQIEKFKAGSNANVLSGTPLKQWPRADRGLVATLAALNIHSVEQLAEISDGNLQNIGIGARELREQAKAFLALAKDSAPVSDMVDQIQHLTLENQRLNQALALSNQQVTELNNRLAEATGVPPPVERKLADITLS